MHFIIKSNRSDREFIFSEFDDEYARVRNQGIRLQSFSADFLYPAGTTLSEYFQDLSLQERQWSGAKTWESIEDDLQFRAECSELGLVELQASVKNTPWGKEAFEVKASLYLDLGSLPDIADQARKFFQLSTDRAT